MILNPRYILLWGPPEDPFRYAKFESANHRHQTCFSHTQIHTGHLQVFGCAQEPQFSTADMGMRSVHSYLQFNTAVYSQTLEVGRPGNEASTFLPPVQYCSSQTLEVGRPGNEAST